MSAPIAWLAERTPRERGLLAVAAALVPVALVFGLLLPLAERRAEAEARLSEAVALRDWVAARVAETTALDAAGPPPSAPPSGPGAVEAGLVAAGLRDLVAGFETAPGGAIEIRFAEVDFQRLMLWLDTAHPGWGYRIAALRLDAAERSGTVAARLRLEPADA